VFGADVRNRPSYWGGLNDLNIDRKWTLRALTYARPRAGLNLSVWTMFKSPRPDLGPTAAKSLYDDGLTSSWSADAWSVPLSANASVPSRAASRLANGTPGHAGAVDHNHTRSTAHTGLRDRGVRLMKRRERHCLCGGSQSQAEHSNGYCSDHFFLPVRTALRGLLGSP
jgi:hypothetical protein